MKWRLVGCLFQRCSFTVYPMRNYKHRDQLDSFGAGPAHTCSSIAPHGLLVQMQAFSSTAVAQHLLLSASSVTWKEGYGVSCTVQSAVFFIQERKPRNTYSPTTSSFVSAQLDLGLAMVLFVIRFTFCFYIWSFPIYRPSHLKCANVGFDGTKQKDAYCLQ